LARSGNIIITQGSQDLVNATTPITIVGKITTTDGSYRGDHRTGTVVVKQGNTEIYSGTFTHGAPANTTTTLFTVELTVVHDANGNAGVITASYNYDNGWCTASATLVVPSISRGSTLTINDGVLGTAQTYTINRDNSGFTHKIRFICGKLSGYILGSSTSASTTIQNQNWIPPLTWATQAPSDTEVSVVFTLETYSGNALIGSNSYTRTFDIPAYIRPGVTMTVSDPTGYLEKYGAYVEGQSKIKVVLTASGAQGSTITAYKIVANGKTYSEAEITTDAITFDGDYRVTAYVTDSRNRTSEIQAKTITAFSYDLPQLKNVRVFRCNEDGTANPVGDHLGVKFSSVVSGLNGGNSAVYTVKYKKKTSGALKTEILEAYDKQYNVVDGLFVFAADTGSSYTITVSVADDFNTTSITLSGPTIRIQSCKFANGAHGIAFGKYAELEDAFDVGWPGHFREGLTVYDSEGKAHDVLNAINEIGTLGNYLPRSGGSKKPLTGSVYLNNNVNFWAKGPDGENYDAFEPKNADGNTLVGWSNYDKKSGDTTIYGHDVWFGVSNIGNPGRYRPYYRRGEGYAIGTIATAGFVTNEGKDVYFILPVTKYIIGSPVISITSVDGFILRQGGSYTHGSGATTWVKPDSYEEVLLPSNCIRIKASFTNTTNVINNDVIGIWWSGRMDFS